MLAGRAARQLAGGQSSGLSNPMRKRITKRSVDALGPAAREVFLWDTELAGFGCKVTPAGRKVYILQYRTRGQDWKRAPKRVTLGKHGELTPELARTLAARLLVEVRSGGDPAAAWRPGESPSVADLAERFLRDYLPAKKRPPRASTVAYYDTLFRCHLTSSRAGISGATSPPSGSPGPGSASELAWTTSRASAPFAYTTCGTTS